MVLQRIQDETGLHKLNLWWEGPFIVYKVIRLGSYRLQGYKTRIVSLTVPWWPGGPKLLEYRASTPFSPLANLFSKLSAAA
jgi:hypothetical protein